MISRRLFLKGLTAVASAAGIAPATASNNTQTADTTEWTYEPLRWQMAWRYYEKDIGVYVCEQPMSDGCRHAILHYLRDMSADPFTNGSGHVFATLPDYRIEEGAHLPSGITWSAPSPVGKEAHGIKAFSTVGGTVQRMQTGMVIDRLGARVTPKGVRYLVSTGLRT